MLRINRVRVEIKTTNGTYGADEVFCPGLNFIASVENTCGKSSIVNAIIYCLGFEQIIGGSGGVGQKVMSSAFKDMVADGDNARRVTESGVYLEICNGNETVTIYRDIKAENRNEKLVKVYYGVLDEVGDPKTQVADYYVHTEGAATREKGFHTFLEDFFHLELPQVRASNGGENKLYLQMIFASMFIEQKHGWSGILSGMYIIRISEHRKRVVEFVLGLDTLKNEKERDSLKAEEARIKQDWQILVNEIQRTVFSETCHAINIPVKPKVLTDKDYGRMAITTVDKLLIVEKVTQLEAERDALNNLKPRVLDNFDALNAELSETESTIISLESDLSNIIRLHSAGIEAISRLKSSLEILRSDLRNNEDAARLQRFGSDATDGDISVEVCPTCKQHLQDSLLAASADNGFMSIEDNIRHLKEQKKMFEFSLTSRKKNQEELSNSRQLLESRLQTLRRLAHALRSDLNTTVEANLSEAILHKKIDITHRIEKLGRLSDFLSTVVEQFKMLSDKWNLYLDRKTKLPSKNVSEADEEKIKLLKRYFVENLKLFNYGSLTSLDGIDITIDHLLPTQDGFDMKFDSSASDGIRMIWAFALALLKVSSEKDGNHPGVVIFDEPAQHSIVPDDMRSFINSVSQHSAKGQIFISITLNSDEVAEIVDSLDNDSYHKVNIEGKAFKLLL